MAKEPQGWSAGFYSTNGVLQVSNVRMICPTCELAVQMAVLAQIIELVDSNSANLHLILRCEYGACRRQCLVWALVDIQRHSLKDSRTIPSPGIDKVHPAIPESIVSDWNEAQKAFSVNALNAAAVMCRRVLYGVLMQQELPEHPLHKSFKELIAKARLPGMFDQWLPAIRDDGHDAAHPYRALQVEADNVPETMEYTAELLRYVYIEPYNFQQRINRAAAPSS